MFTASIYTLTFDISPLGRVLEGWGVIKDSASQRELDVSARGGLWVIGATLLFLVNNVVTETVFAFCGCTLLMSRLRSTIGISEGKHNTDFGC
jgi:hypothetical protein